MARSLGVGESGSKTKKTPLARLTLPEELYRLRYGILQAVAPKVSSSEGEPTPETPETLSSRRALQVNIGAKIRLLDVFFI